MLIETKQLSRIFRSKSYLESPFTLYGVARYFPPIASLSKLGHTFFSNYNGQPVFDGLLYDLIQLCVMTLIYLLLPDSNC